jgi:AcrR family transcriptional regulator
MTNAATDEKVADRSDPDSRIPILETTYGLLGTTPFDKLSMQHIADSAGVSKALLFYFFKSKRELVREALIFGTKREMEGFHTFMGTDGEEGEVGLSIPFSEIISHWMTNSLERIQILHTYFEVTDIEDPEDVVNVELRSLFDHIIGYLEEILRGNGMAYPREQATLMAVMIDTYGFIPHLTPAPFDDARYRAAFLDLFQFTSLSTTDPHNQGER